MIILGHYSFSIDSYDTSEINIEGFSEKEDIFQLSVRVFHIFWIPVCPIEKLWVLKRNGDKFIVNNELSEFLDKFKGRKRTPWYSYALLIITPMLFLLLDLFGFLR